MAPKPMSFFTYQGVALPNPPTNLGDCSDDTMTTAWIVNQLRQCSSNMARTIVNADGVKHLDSILGIIFFLLTNRFPRSSSSSGFPSNSGKVQFGATHPGNLTLRYNARPLQPSSSPTATLHTTPASNAPQATVLGRPSLAMPRALRF
jgi:hypothetical protein